MELHLDPIIPVTRVVNGHNVFNKGYRHGLRGKTYEEYYGEERAKEIRKRHSEALKGHPYWSNRRAAAKPCVVIHQGKKVRFRHRRVNVAWHQLRHRKAVSERQNQESQERLAVVLRE